MSHLVREPYSLTPDRVRALTPYQVRRVYFRPEKDEKGKSPPAPTREQLARRVFCAALLALGLGESSVELLWKRESEGKS